MKPSYMGSRSSGCRAKENGGGKDNGRPSSNPAKCTLTGMIPELPVLIPPNSPAYNVVTNGFQHFKEKWTIYFSTKYGLCGSFLTTGVYHDPDPPDAPDFDYDPTDRDSVIFGRFMRQNVAST